MNFWWRPLLIVRKTEVTKREEKRRERYKHKTWNISLVQNSRKFLEACTKWVVVEWLNSFTGGLTQPPPPPPSLPEIQGVPMRIPYHGTLRLGKTDGPFYGLFHITSTPLSRELFPIDPLSREHYGDPIPFLFFSSGLGNMCTYFTATLEQSMALPQNCNVIKALSPFLGRLLNARETCTYKSYPLFLNFSASLVKNIPYLRRSFKKTPFSRFSREIFPRQTAKKHPLFRENGNMQAAPLVHSRGGGGGRTNYS